jgi:hypothetical protein
MPPKYAPNNEIPSSDGGVRPRPVSDNRAVYLQPRRRMMQNWADYLTALARIRGSADDIWAYSESGHTPK